MRRTTEYAKHTKTHNHRRDAFHESTFRVIRGFRGWKISKPKPAPRTHKNWPQKNTKITRDSAFFAFSRGNQISKPKLNRRVLCQLHHFLKLFIRRVRRTPSSFCRERGDDLPRRCASTAETHFKSRASVRASSRRLPQFQQRPPSTRPSPKGKRETCAVSLKNRARDLPDGPPPIQKPFAA